MIGAWKARLRSTDRKQVRLYYGKLTVARSNAINVIILLATQIGRPPFLETRAGRRNL